MNWIKSAKELFHTSKPEHFTNYNHCEECLEHDQTLLASDIDTIGLKELGNPGWDPICFASPEGKKYYLPAFVRLSLDSLDDDFYFAQLLFHLEGDGPENEFYLNCNEEQRKFIADFITFMVENHTVKLEENYCSDTALRSYQIWSS